MGPGTPLHGERIGKPPNQRSADGLASYGHTVLRFFQGGSEVYSTDALLLNSVTAEVAKLEPRCEIYEGKLDTGDSYVAGLSRFNNGHIDLYRWIVRQQCQQGCEPLQRDHADPTIQCDWLALSFERPG
jgi:hypothetical protein